MAQKTVLAIAQQLASEINLPRPSGLVSAQDGSGIKLLELIRAVCDDLLSEFDWQFLIRRYSFNTVNAQEAYDFPSDIQRFISGSFFDSSRRWSLRGPLTATQWEALLTTQLASSPFQQYRIFGNQIHFQPVPGTTSYTFVYEFISSNYVIDGNTGISKADFEQDSDICAFDHRLVIYGTKLKWLQSLKHDTTAALMEFQRQLEFQKGSNTPSPILDARGSRGPHLIDTSNIPDGSWVV